MIFKAAPSKLTIPVALMICLFTMSACAQPAAPTATALPTLVPSLTPTSAPDIQVAVEGTLTALAPAPAASATPTLTPTVTATLPSVELPATLGRASDPPIEITFPQGWQVAQNDALIIPDADNSLRAIPYVAYNGPISGGQGTIVLLWGFPSLVNPFPQDGTPGVNLIDPSQSNVKPDLWSDGLRLLRLAIVEPGCNVGTDLKRAYRVGALSGDGTQFAAVECPQLPDTRGWFVGVTHSNLNYIFYMFSDPIGAMDRGQSELQGILDTIVFHAPVTPQPTP